MTGAAPAQHDHGAAHGVPAPRPAGLALVLAASVYDGLLCLALVFIVGAVAVAINGGDAIPPGTVLFELTLLAAPFPYFAWCWIRGGHTLGMRAWRLGIARADGAPLTLRDALVRYLGALLSWAAAGLGFLWMIPAPHLSWHDRLSGTRIHRTG